MTVYGQIRTCLSKRGSVKFIGLISVIGVLLFSGCKVEFVSRIDNNKVYASNSACSDSKVQAQEDAIMGITKNYPLIEDELRSYIQTNAIKGEGRFCYEAVITRKHWSQYTSALKDEKEEIISHATEYVTIFEYNDKSVLTKTLLTERHNFNEKLNIAKSIAPMDVEPFPDNFKSLNSAINVLPSVKINVRPCNRNKNYNCDVKFLTEVKDESSKLTYLWDFGEGSKAETKNATHRYDTEGRYSVSLQVTDESGLSTFRIKDVLVTKSKQKLKAREKSDLKAYFILKQKSYVVNDDVFFDNYSKATGSQIKEYLWDFGDGEVSTVRNPYHRYKKSGTYVVKYKVCNTENDCAYASSSVKVVLPRKAKPASSKKAAVKKPVKVAKAPVVKAPVAKKSTFNAKVDEPIQEYIAKNGKATKTVIKKNATMTAYLYGDVWLLVKRGKIECAVKKKGFKTSLMGEPKKCRWHEKNAKNYMVKLTQESFFSK